MNGRIRKNINHETPSSAISKFFSGRHGLRGIMRATVYVLIAVFIFLTFLAVLGNTNSTLGPFRIGLEFSWGWPGETRLNIPPLGEVKADTHHLPVVLSATIDRIDLALLQHELMGITDAAQYMDTIIPRAMTVFYYFLAKLCLLGGMAGLLVGLLFGWRGFSKLWRTFAVGLLVVVLILGGLIMDFDRNAFATPRYEGALEAAPWALSLIDQGLTQLPEFSAKLSLVAGNLSRLFAQVDRLDSLAKVGGELKVLHVSDIHNNPAGLEFISRVIEGFGVDLIIDTGDLTDYGTALETELTGRIKTLDVEYLFIPGNHDSPEVIKSIERFPNVTVLEKGFYEYEGLTIMGWADPAVWLKDRLIADPETLKAEAELIAEYWDKLQARPDVLAVHNGRLAGLLRNPPPVTVCGHTHQTVIKETPTKEGTAVYINAGTSGAAGLRGLSDDNLPYSVALLHFAEVEPDEGKRKQKQYQLTAVDSIKVYSLRGKFSLERKVVSGGLETVGSDHSDSQLSGEADGGKAK